jgi:hypothetical protein
MALMSCRYGRVRKTCYLADLTSGCLVRSCRDAQALAGWLQLISCDAFQRYV